MVQLLYCYIFSYYSPVNSNCADKISPYLYLQSPMILFQPREIPFQRFCAFAFKRFHEMARPGVQRRRQINGPAAGNDCTFYGFKAQLLAYHHKNLLNRRFYSLYQNLISIFIHPFKTIQAMFHCMRRFLILLGFSLGWQDYCGINIYAPT